MDLVLNRNSRGSFGRRCAKDFSFPASSCTAAPANKCRIDENGSFMCLSSSGEPGQRCGKCVYMYGCVLLLDGIKTARFLSRIDRHIYSTQRAKTSACVNSQSTFQLRIVLIKATERLCEVWLMQKLHRVLGLLTHFLNTCSPLWVL